jgi:hypothetical protein
MSSSVGTSPGSTGRQPRDIADRDKRRAAEIGRAGFLSETREAIAEIRSRPVTRVPGTLGAIGEMVRKNIVAEIERGATPIRVTDESGKEITVGALRGDKYTGRSEYEAIARETRGTQPIQISGGQARQPRQEGGETPTLITPEVTPEVTPEIVPDDLMGGAERGRRRTSRAGPGGTLATGTGFLYTSK